jgi:hypothetical protein
MNDETSLGDVSRNRRTAARLLAERYAANLQLLNRTLAETALADRFALFGGLLLGLARDGRPLPGDLDADFYYLDTFDREFEHAIDALVAAGFKRLFRFRANDGEFWEHTFSKDLAKFEFFRCRRAGGGELHYHNFVPMAPPRQQLLRYPDGPLKDFSFLGCRWLTVADVDAGLTMHYGDWRTPDPTWVWHHDPLALKVEPWHFSHEIRWQPGESG